MTKDRKKSINETYITEEGMDNLWNVWYSELHDGVSGLTLKIDRFHESTSSKFQRIEVIDNKDFGKLLVLYGSLMVADNDNNSYNEMISHVPLFVHATPKQVLIVGGGDCGALTEVLKHPGVKKCTMCEIDKKVVETSEKHFPRLTAGLTDPRAKVIFEDGKEYIGRGGGAYDIVILDLSDPVGPAADLFQKKFHQQVFDQLNDDGILIAQTESPFYNRTTVKALYANLREIFPIVKMYLCFMPIYPSGLWSFAFCSKKYDPLADFDQKRYDKLQLKTRYYNDEVHRAAFALPQFVKDLF
ncbi:MAG: polyamine aminopropyltransferase [Candidatus Zixiibacteriota bacterium]|nr:MAG: polyamine aminopropyltransferase [candidate division Zixibacteria bacterium]